MATVFICYRREDAPATTGRIYDHLVQSYGSGSVFKDVDSIPVGADFPTHIQHILRQATAQVVIIGPHWLNVLDENGRPRLQNPGDFVRQEVETALANGIPVIPVLVEGAAIPPARLLPPSLAQLPRLQAVSIRFDPDFSTDVHRLIAAIEHVDPRGTAARPQGAHADTSFPSKARRRPWLFGGIAAVLAVLLVVLAATRGAFQFPSIGTVARTPTATATATATPIVGAIYQNALALPTSGWTIDEQCHFLSDGYHDDYTVGEKNTTITCYGPVQVKDAVIVVDAKLISGPLDFGYGVVFRSDTHHSEYGFLISSDGHWTTYKLVNNELTHIINWTASSQIHKNKGAHNLLTVYFKGTHMNFFINGILVGQADDDTFSSDGTVGLTVSAGQNVVFANFSVTGA
ncbi:MAG TPA: toll/interleukin-1 receptor domain-containing protein [Ktedonobacterales bacterium]|nr:toll/interleukin-1 receptor domain-containing protein [Ktedonobacterales bacterium]